LTVSLVVGVALVLLAAALVAWHWFAWRRWGLGTFDELHREFAWRQFRRRVQTSVMVGLVGVAIVAADAVDSPIASLVAWLVALVLLVWVMLLAAADALATRTHYSRLARRQVDEYAHLSTEYRRLKKQHDTRGNGHTDR